MKITICGSIAFYDEMLDIKSKLELSGHKVKLPPHEIKDDSGAMISVKEYYTKRKSTTDNDSWVWDRKTEAITNHFDKVCWADVILVTNYNKNDINGYVGGNTLIEMGVAFFLKKPIYLLKQIPKISYKEEIIGMKPVVINNDLEKIV
ncbi:MAG TPA: hypothetical protein ENI76_09610 [Ignavibacteria bacterium]|nr:hypothetical protein [Ignavibacteria bacterium]